MSIFLGRSVTKHNSVLSRAAWVLYCHRRDINHRHVHRAIALFISEHLAVAHEFVRKKRLDFSPFLGQFLVQKLHFFVVKHFLSNFNLQLLARTFLIGFLQLGAISESG